MVENCKDLRIHSNGVHILKAGLRLILHQQDHVQVGKGFRSLRRRKAQFLEFAVNFPFKCKKKKKKKNHLTC